MACMHTKNVVTENTVAPHSKDCWINEEGMRLFIWAEQDLIVKKGGGAVIL